MSLPAFLVYQEKVLKKFAEFWSQSTEDQIQEPEEWQNLIAEYCDRQFEYDVEHWPLDPRYPKMTILSRSEPTLTITWAEEKKELLERIESLESDVRAIINRLDPGTTEINEK